MHPDRARVGWCMFRHVESVHAGRLVEEQHITSLPLPLKMKGEL